MLSHYFIPWDVYIEVWKDLMSRHIVIKLFSLKYFFYFSEIVRLLMSMQVDRINQKRIFWSGKYVNPNSKEYKTLEGESNYAVSNKMKKFSTIWNWHVSTTNIFVLIMLKCFCELSTFLFLSFLSSFPQWKIHLCHFQIPKTYNHVFLRHFYTFRNVNNVQFYGEFVRHS